VLKCNINFSGLYKLATGECLVERNHQKVQGTGWGITLKVATVICIRMNVHIRLKEKVDLLIASKLSSRFYINFTEIFVGYRSFK
jgi:hypothetical protein